MNPAIMRACMTSMLWAIRPEALNQLFQLSEAMAAQPTAPTMRADGVDKITIIPIQGVLTKDGPAWLGSNYETIGAMVERAATDPDVKRIVLSVDSPGGHVVGLPETGALIAQAAKQKPVSAIVTGTAASAAYWLTSQARDITLTPSGEVGSVGVRVAHMDFSKALEQEGVKVTELYAGQYKTEWSPYGPLTDAAKANMQERLDAHRQEFVAAIAGARGMRTSAAMKESGFGEGRIFSAEEARAHGLVDTIQTPRDFFRSLMPTQSGQPARRMRAMLELERVRAN